MKPSRWAAIAAGVAAVVLLFLVLRPGDDEPAPTPSPTETPSQSPIPDAVEIEIEVEDGEIAGPGEVEVTQGERVRIVVKADVSDEVHVHGYDLTADVTPLEAAVIVFRADAPGVYEVELESAGLLLLELSVVP